MPHRKFGRGIMYNGRKKKGGHIHMDKLLTVIANCIFEYGRKGAGFPSHHGAYEEEVPQTLQNHDED